MVAEIAFAADVEPTVADFLRGDAEPPPGPADLAGIPRDQWLTEAASRGLRNLRVLPLKWSAAERDASDRLDALVPSGPSRDGAARSAAGRVPGTRRAGPGQPARAVRLRLDGRFDEAADRLPAALPAATGWVSGPGRWSLAGWFEDGATTRGRAWRGPRSPLSGPLRRRAHG